MGHRSFLEAVVLCLVLDFQLRFYLVYESNGLFSIFGGNADTEINARHVL